VRRVVCLEASYQHDAAASRRKGRDTDSCGWVAAAWHHSATSRRDTRGCKALSRTCLAFAATSSTAKLIWIPDEDSSSKVNHLASMASSPATGSPESQPQSTAMSTKCRVTVPSAAVSTASSAVKASVAWAMTPVSSRSSRTAACSVASPNSILPPGKPQSPASGGLILRTRIIASPRRTTAITAATGVRACSSMTDTIASCRAFCLAGVPGRRFPLSQWHPVRQTKPNRARPLCPSTLDSRRESGHFDCRTGRRTVLTFVCGLMPSDGDSRHSAKRSTRAGYSVC